jgi:hypothetical protein
LDLGQAKRQDCLGCLLTAVCAQMQLQMALRLARLAFERSLRAQA